MSTCSPVAVAAQQVGVVGHLLVDRDLGDGQASQLADVGGAAGRHGSGVASPCLDPRQRAVVAGQSRRRSRGRSATRRGPRRCRTPWARRRRRTSRCRRGRSGRTRNGSDRLAASPSSRAAARRTAAASRRGCSRRPGRRGGSRPRAAACRAPRRRGRCGRRAPARSACPRRRPARRPPRRRSRCVAASSRSRSSAGSAAAELVDVGVAGLLRGVHRRRLALGRGRVSAPASPSAFSARCATTWARVQPGSRARLAERVVRQGVDGAHQALGRPRAATRSWRSSSGMVTSCRRVGGDQRQHLVPDAARWRDCRR